MKKTTVNNFRSLLRPGIAAHAARTLLLGALLPLVAACGDDGPEPAPEPEPPSGPVGRTVLVYIVSNNNLGYAQDPDEGIVDGYDNADIEEMKTAAHNGALQGNRLILFHADYMATPQLKEVTPEGETVLLREFDSSSPATSASRMAEVIAAAKEAAPAERYGLVLWSHASGWLENGMTEEPPYGASSVQPQSFGSDGGKRMNVTTLARVLDGEAFDYLWFDCCHMANVEVAYELRHVTGAIVGSASELPSKGMPYDLTLPYLMADEPDLTAAAQTVFENYDSFRAPEDAWKRTCTMSVISTASLDALADASRQLFALSDRCVPFSEVQAFTQSGTYYDLGHYMERLARTGEDGAGTTDALQAAYASVERALDKAVVYKAATPWLWEGMRYDKVKIDHHCGLSTYIINRPGGENTSNYRNLQWWKDVASVFWTK